MKTAEEWKTTLQLKLRDALKARQDHLVAVLRETLAAIDNAEAPPIGSFNIKVESEIAGSVSGLRAGEISRLALSPEAVATIVQNEITERRDAAAMYSRLGKNDEARKLISQAEMLECLCSESR